jgi:hypothetical protein
MRLVSTLLFSENDRLRECKRVGFVKLESWRDTRYIGIRGKIPVLADTQVIRGKIPEDVRLVSRDNT